MFFSGLVPFLIVFFLFHLLMYLIDLHLAGFKTFKGTAWCRKIFISLHCFYPNFRSLRITSGGLIPVLIVIQPVSLSIVFIVWTDLLVTCFLVKKFLLYKVLLNNVILCVFFLIVFHRQFYNFLVCSDFLFETVLLR